MMERFILRYQARETSYMLEVSKSASLAGVLAEFQEKGTPYRLSVINAHGEEHLVEELLAAERKPSIDRQARRLELLREIRDEIEVVPAIDKEDKR